MTNYSKASSELKAVRDDLTALWEHIYAAEEQGKQLDCNYLMRELMRNAVKCGRLSGDVERAVRPFIQEVAK